MTPNKISHFFFGGFVIVLDEDNIHSFCLYVKCGRKMTNRKKAPINDGIHVVGMTLKRIEK
jgi:hypothetical protein